MRKLEDFKIDSELMQVIKKEMPEKVKEAETELKAEIKKNEILTQEITTGRMPITNVKHCPKCKSKLKKWRVQKTGQKAEQAIKCKNKACDFGLILCIDLS